MRVKITHPIRDGERLYFAGTTADVDAKKAERWIENDWCVELDDEPPAEVEGAKEKVKRGKKSE